jgi:CRISPR system Cascade subunit CasC
MLIDIHMIQNHSPSNLNRDDLGAPKTCYFSGVLRNRISSQCLKRSIRMSKEFKDLLGGFRTRRLAEEISSKVEGNGIKEKVTKILKECGLDEKKNDTTKMAIYVSQKAIEEMARLVGGKIDDKQLVECFCKLIAEEVAVPDMALCGRMLETGVIKNTTVEAALQAAHAISTHQAVSEVDYFVAADDLPGDDAGAAYVDEAMFASACFYKYFSIDWNQLVTNLKGNEKLAAHTVGAFLRGAALTSPTGKQNSFAAHNPPEGIVVEIKDTPISYANAFAAPAPLAGSRDMVSQSIAQLGQYIHDIDTGFGGPKNRFWFSPNLRQKLEYVKDKKMETLGEQIESLNTLVERLISEIGFNWQDVQNVKIN